MVGVEADLCGKIESHRKARLAFAQEITIAAVGFDGRAEAGILAHGPEAAAVHRGIDSARVRKFAGVAEAGFRIPAGEIFFGVKRIDGKAGKSGEFFLASGGGSGFEFRVRHAIQKMENRKVKIEPKIRSLLHPATVAVVTLCVRGGTKSRRNTQIAKPWRPQGQ